MNPQQRFRGCLLGGAVGDALGAPVEFMAWNQIVSAFGATGIRDFAPAYGRLGAITDDTQMTLFTGEGLLRAYVRGCLRGFTAFEGVADHAYRRWLATQGYSPAALVSHNGWLWDVEALHSVRAPGNTCLSALMTKQSSGTPAANDSKGCGGVMRVAPVGMYMWHWRDRQDAARRAFELGAALAGLTHGHPTGQWPAGVMAVVVMRALDGVPVAQALPEAKAILLTCDSHQETLAAIQQAEALAASGLPPSVVTVESLGAGWVAEEALAIALYAALVAESLEEGIALAVNHSGDSDSTGSMAGNLLGAMHGESALPQRWSDAVELSDVIGQMADDLYQYPTWRISDWGPSEDQARIWPRYPGG